MAVVKRFWAFVQGLVGLVAGRWTVFYAHILYKLVGLEAVMHHVKHLRQPVRVLQSFGVQVGEGTIIYPGIIVHAAVGDFSNLKIGENCRIGRDCFFDLTEPIKIGDMASVGMRTMLITHVNFAYSPLASEFEPQSAPITIGAGAVTFAGVTILKGVTLGECAVAAAGAVISTDVPSWTMVAGNPARLLRRLAKPQLDSKILVL